MAWPFAIDFPNNLIYASFGSPCRCHFRQLTRQDVPVDWDETHWLAGEVGQSLVLARRKGKDEYLGAINDSKAKSFDLSLSWLKGGKYVSEIFSDT